MNYYRVQLWAVGQSAVGNDALLADIELWAETAERARQKVFEEHWDPRLDAADCAARYETWGVDKNTNECFDLPENDK